MRSSAPRPLGHVVVLRAGALGDLVVTLPVLHALRPSCTQLDLACPGRLGVLASRTGLADRVLDVLGAGMLWLFHGPGSPDWSDVDLAVTYLSGTEGVLARAGVRRVLSGTGDGPLLPVHRQLLDALRPLGLSETPVTLRVDWPTNQTEAAVTLAPGSGGARKRWPLPCWVEVSQRLVQEGLPVRWSAGPDEALECETWPCREAGASLVFEQDLARSADLAASSLAWAGVDAGTSHLAALVGCPTIVLFGPTNPARWCPPGALALSLEARPIDVARHVLACCRSGDG
jgi:heptosyltransferase III